MTGPHSIVKLWTYGAATLLWWLIKAAVLYSHWNEEILKTQAAVLFRLKIKSLVSPNGCDVNISLNIFNFEEKKKKHCKWQWLHGWWQWLACVHKLLGRHLFTLGLCSCPLPSSRNLRREAPCDRWREIRKHVHSSWFITFDEANSQLQRRPSCFVPSHFIFLS